MIAVMFLMAFLAIHGESFFGDEGFHFEQLRRFHEGDFSIDHQLTMLPGYHLVLFAFSRAAGIHDLNFYRFINILISLLSVAVFRAILGILHPRATATRVVQYAFLPILFPYFLFVYTDAFSLFVILLALWLFLRHWYTASAAMITASLLVRQNNIIWLLFLLAALVLAELPGFLRIVRQKFILFALLRRIRERYRTRVTRVRLLSAVAVFIMGIVLFAAFVWWNQGIAIGDKESHPFPSFHPGNIYFCLFLSFFMFLPLHLSNTKRIITALRTSRILWPLFLVFFLIFMMTFVNDHGYNQGLDSVYLRNRILTYFTETPTLKMLFFVPVGYSFLSFWTTRLTWPFSTLLYPATILYLLPSWLVEQRYYFVPMVLFLLFRESKSSRLETISAVYSGTFAILLFVPVALRWFFL